MRIQISATELKKILDEKFNGDHFYDLSFMESDYALRERLGEGKYKRLKELPQKTLAVRAIFEKMSVITSIYDLDE